MAFAQLPGTEHKKASMAAILERHSGLQRDERCREEVAEAERGDEEVKHRLSPTRTMSEARRREKVRAYTFDLSSSMIMRP